MAVMDTPTALFKIQLGATFGRKPPGSVWDVHGVMPHGGYTDSPRQFVLYDGTHVAEEFATIVPAQPLVSVDAQKAFGALYSKTGMDWLLQVHHILTEPVCPCAMIHAEGDDPANPKWPAFSEGATTIEEAIRAVVAAAYEWALLA